MGTVAECWRSVKLLYVAMNGSRCGVRGDMAQGWPSLLHFYQGVTSLNKSVPATLFSGLQSAPPSFYLIAAANRILKQQLPLPEAHFGGNPGATRQTCVREQAE